MKTSPSANELLEWYDRHARDLPWRVSPEDRRLGVVPDPYHVWLSEIMLQQTTVAAVKDYYIKFLSLWPRVEDLAAAPEEDVMKAWAGLGYYSRARNLKRCAETVADLHEGRFPETVSGLQALPGIGPYTAAAIAAIAFDQPAAVVDGNVERVMTRLYEITTPLPEAKPEIKAVMAALTPEARPGDFAQAVMDLGATLCTPKRPACSLCPWMAGCAARASGLAETLPRKAPKKTKPTRTGAAFVALRASDKAVMLRRRPPKGLLGGMSEVPGTEWTVEADEATFVHSAPLQDIGATLDWRPVTGVVRHTFTHFHLELTIFRAMVPDNAGLPENCWWSPPQDLPDEALPTVMRKAIDAAF
ncbi:A/G-specific adenine glycosylase [Roseibium litorale]|uniref:Adenine DNA glycosylase n=1 Tax=Roseibium litorale TaxID=2803841 RepID=A0ABR9CQU5_9HYPH|nr:A/G-specific adenine glycosylase [Roseibium litorale]MBD8893034.1 A/G-specific adenine glycosylase [Roseibium litorale]